MNITPTVRSITEYTLQLSEQDAAEAMADPYSFAKRIAEQLRAAGVVAVSASRPARKPKPATKNGASKRLKPKAATGGVVCPQCSQKLLTQGFLERHLRQKHGSSPASDAASTSTP